LRREAKKQLLNYTSLVGGFRNEANPPTRSGELRNYRAGYLSRMLENRALVKLPPRLIFALAPRAVLYIGE
jgi:hypothetical protein